MPTYPLILVDEKHDWLDLPVESVDRRRQWVRWCRDCGCVSFSSEVFVSYRLPGGQPRSEEPECPKRASAPVGKNHCHCGKWHLAERKRVFDPLAWHVDDRGVRHALEECAPIFCACPVGCQIAALDEWIVKDGIKHTPQGCAPQSAAV